jgi:competence protein ComEA
MSNARRAQWLLFIAIFVFAGVAWSQSQQPLPEDKRLDLNTATVDDLRKLPGIGKTTAQAIVRFREKSGPFRRVEDLLAIRGITKKKLDKIRPLVKVGSG